MLPVTVARFQLVHALVLGLQVERLKADCANCPNTDFGANAEGCLGGAALAPPPSLQTTAR